ncbi:MAG: hypothetical protein AB7U36_10560 [Desulfobacter sp.]
MILVRFDPGGCLPVYLPGSCCVWSTGHGYPCQQYHATRVRALPGRSSRRHLIHGHRPPGWALRELGFNLVHAFFYGNIPAFPT